MDSEVNRNRFTDEEHAVSKAISDWLLSRASIAFDAGIQCYREGEYNDASKHGYTGAILKVLAVEILAGEWKT